MIIIYMHKLLDRIWYIACLLYLYFILYVSISVPGSVSSSLIFGGRKKTTATYYWKQVTHHSCAHKLRIQVWLLSSLDRCMFTCIISLMRYAKKCCLRFVKTAVTFYYCNATHTFQYFNTWFYSSYIVVFRFPAIELCFVVVSAPYIRF